MTWLLTPLGRLASIAGVLAAYFAWLLVHDARVEQRGADRAVATIEKANDQAAKLGSDAAARSLDKRVRGKRDATPHD